MRIVRVRKGKCSVAILFGVGFVYLLSKFFNLTSEVETRSKENGTTTSVSNQNGSIENLVLSPSLPLDSASFSLISRFEVSIAEKLFKEVRVLCWVMTTPANHASKAIHVKNTWGRRCNKLLFFSSKEDPTLESIVVANTHGGRKFLWRKTRGAFKYVFEHHFDEADWFLKADDDTYVILENLRYFLKDYDSMDPVYFGCRFNYGVNGTKIKQGYMSGGAGYVLSRTALQRFINEGYNNPKICPQGKLNLNEDWEIGKCLANVGVRAVDSRDNFGRYRFLPFNVGSHIHGKPDPTFWYWRRIVDAQNQSRDKYLVEAFNSNPMDTDVPNVTRSDLMLIIGQKTQEQRYSNIVNSNEIAGDVFHVLECPRCKQLLPPPIYLCETGHSICYECCAELLNCPKCQSPFTKIRNVLAESLISKLFFKCPNWKNGCLFSTMGGNGLDQHRKDCRFGTIVCSIGHEVSCGETITITEYVQHLLSVHKINGVDSYKAVISMSTSVSLGNGNWTFPPNYLKAFGHTFLCFVHASYNLIFLWISAIGSAEDLSRYAGSITIFDPANKLLQSKWTGPIHSICMTPQDVFTTGACLTLIPETFMALAKVIPLSAESKIEEKPVIHWKCHYELFDRTVSIDSNTIRISNESVIDPTKNRSELSQATNNSDGLTECI